ncbi:hypothetical protein ACFL1H_02350, partial [Nanoarchaeota archaeon]
GILFIIFAVCFYFYYKTLNSNLFSYLLIHIAMVLHMLGRFGFYAMKVFGINYDYIVHVLAGISLGLFVYFALVNRIKKVHFLWFLIIVFLISSGIGLLGEFVEFGGTLWWEHGQGLLALDAEAGPYDHVSNDYWDTMSDMVANSVGIIFGIIVAVLLRKYYFREK